jgi:protein-tyrosine phosphatase
MLLPDIYWIKDFLAGNLAIMPKPRSNEWLEDEIQEFNNQAVNLVVCLLTTDEIYELELQKEETLCERYQIQYISFPIEDRSVPSFLDTKRLVDHLLNQLKEGTKVAVHCRAGIGRAGLITASILIRFGIEPEHACRLISKARKIQVPETEEQQRWLVYFKDYLKNNP